MTPKFSSALVETTPEQAAALLETSVDSPIDNDAVAQYVRDMVAGSWQLNETPINFEGEAHGK